MIMPINDKKFLKQIFLEARTYHAWKDQEVKDTLLAEIYDLMKFGPTSTNCTPLRIIFVKSQAAKEILKPCLASGNVKQTMCAPVTAIFSYDTEFYEHLPFLAPHTNAKSWFEGKPDYIEKTAVLNSALQAAYFMIAARMKGLDCGPMSGFNQTKTNQAFFEDTPYKSLFLCNLGYGEPKDQHPRAPRFEFSEICDIR